jgi:hypothetical protein
VPEAAPAVVLVSLVGVLLLQFWLSLVILMVTPLVTLLPLLDPLLCLVCVHIEVPAVWTCRGLALALAGCCLLPAGNVGGLEIPVNLCVCIMSIGSCILG